MYANNYQYAAHNSFEEAVSHSNLTGGDEGKELLNGRQ